MKNNSFHNTGNTQGNTVGIPGGVLPRMPGNAGGSNNRNIPGGQRVLKSDRTADVKSIRPENDEYAGKGSGSAMSAGKAVKGELSFTRDALINGFKMGIILGPPLSRARMPGGRRYRK